MKFPSREERNHIRLCYPKGTRAKLYSLDDIVKLSNAVKIYNNVDSCVAQIDNAIKTLQLVKDMLLNKD